VCTLQHTLHQSPSQGEELSLQAVGHRIVVVNKYRPDDKQEHKQAMLGKKVVVSPVQHFVACEDIAPYGLLCACRNGVHDRRGIVYLGVDDIGDV